MMMMLLLTMIVMIISIILNLEATSQDVASLNPQQIEISDKAMSRGRTRQREASNSRSTRAAPIAAIVPIASSRV